VGEQSSCREEDPEDRVGDRERRSGYRERLPDEELLTRIGVIKIGSSVPCSRSPTTE